MTETNTIRHYFIDEENVLCYMEGTLEQWRKMFKDWADYCGTDYEDCSTEDNPNDQLLLDGINTLDNDSCNCVVGDMLCDDMPQSLTIKDAGHGNENIELSDHEQSVLDNLSPKQQQVILDYLHQTN